MLNEQVQYHCRFIIIDKICQILFQAIVRIEPVKYEIDKLKLLKQIRIISEYERCVHRILLIRARLRYHVLTIATLIRCCRIFPQAVWKSSNAETFPTRRSTIWMADCGHPRQTAAEHLNSLAYLLASSTTYSYVWRTPRRWMVRIFVLRNGWKPSCSNWVRLHALAVCCTQSNDSFAQPRELHHRNWID